MNWKLRIGKSARKNLTRFPKNDQERIIAALREFILSPYSGDIEKVKGEENTWRRRVGNYRILYEVDIKNKFIDVVYIRRRTSSTY